MKTELKQRSNEWRLRRLGMVTASRFRDVLTQPRTKKAKDVGEMSATSVAYKRDLLTEMLIGQPMDRFTSRATDWGNEWESSAFEEAKGVIQKHYNVEVFMPTNEFAFMEHPDEPLIGCSPDGVIGDDGLLELKAPYRPSNHLDTTLAGAMPKQHEAQVQGSLWISGRQWYAFGSYDPRFKDTAIEPLCFYEVRRDEEYIAKLASKVTAFRDVLMETFDRIVAKYDKRTKAPF